MKKERKNAIIKAAAKAAKKGETKSQWFLWKAKESANNAKARKEAKAALKALKKKRNK